MKFKVGDKVKVREDLEIDKTYGNYTFINSMSNFAGKIVTIKEIERDSYRIVEMDCCWTDEMFISPGYKPKDPTHIVIWDTENVDPHRFFPSEKEARDFMKELSEKSDVVQDSVILVAIKSAQKVSITKLVRFKNYKI